MNNRFKKTIIFLMAIILVIAPFVVLKMKSVRAEEAESITKKITITKKWINDKADEDRPANLTVHIKKTESTLKTGVEVKNMMITAAGSASNIEQILRATKKQYEDAGKPTTYNISNGGNPVYVWYDNKKIYYYSESANIYMNADSSNMFSGLPKLTNISGLSEFNATYVTNMCKLFSNSNSLVTLSPIADWDVSNVTSMRGAFGSDYTGPTGSVSPMSINSVTALSTWNMQKVTDMGLMFKGCVALSDISTISGWNVSNVANVNQMFMRCAINDATPIKGWNLVRVGSTYHNAANNTSATGSFSQMFTHQNDVKDSQPASIAQFTNRPGTWNKGSYTASAGPASGSAQTITKVKDTWSEKDSTDSICTISKSGDTWTYEFTVSNDGTKYEIWEDVPTNYKVIGKGSPSDHIKDVTESTTIKNINKKVKVTKKWEGDSDLTRPSSINIHLNNPTDGSTLTPSDPVKNGDTWTYEFTIDDPTEEDVYKVWEDTVNPYDSNATSSNKLTVDSNNRATITNTLRAYNISISKIVTGNMADVDKTFSYELKFYNSQDELVNSGITITDPKVSLDAGIFRINLKHGESVTIENIPEGFKYEIEETTDNYDPSFKITNSDNDNIISTGTTASTGKIELNENQNVEFSNNKEVSVLTGIFINNLPFIALILLGFIGINIINVYKKRIIEY